jgi:hypothetical protein
VSEGIASGGEAGEEGVVVAGAEAEDAGVELREAAAEDRGDRGGWPASGAHAAAASRAARRGIWICVAFRASGLASASSPGQGLGPNVSAC